MCRCCDNTHPSCKTGFECQDTKRGRKCLRAYPSLRLQAAWTVLRVMNGIGLCSLPSRTSCNDGVVCMCSAAALSKSARGMDWVVWGCRVCVAGYNAMQAAVLRLRACHGDVVSRGHVPSRSALSRGVCGYQDHLFQRARSLSSEVGHFTTEMTVARTTSPG